VGVFKAAGYHFVVNMTAYLGCIAGILLSDSASYRPYILAFTAGNFLYIALAALIPELNSGSSHSHSHSHSLPQNHSSDHLPTTVTPEDHTKEHTSSTPHPTHSHSTASSIITHIGILLGIFIMWAIAVWGE
jgi:hypothetical protein